MRTLLAMTIVAAGLTLSTQANATKALAEGGDQYACVALSTSGKPAWGAQSKMPDAAICAKDALRFCKEHHLKKGENGKCDVGASSAWIIGLRCHSGTKVVITGDHDTAFKAATTALQNVKDRSIGDCDFMVLRHGSDYGRVEDETSLWTASVQCGSKTSRVSVNGGAKALNAAFIKAARIDAKYGACKILSLDDKS